MGSRTEASRAIISALEEIDGQKLKILAIGPMTNIATVKLLRPDLFTREFIDSIVVVAGRRPGEELIVDGAGGR